MFEPGDPFLLLLISKLDEFNNRKTSMGYQYTHVQLRLNDN